MNIINTKLQETGFSNQTKSNFIRIWKVEAPFSNGKDDLKCPLPNRHHPALQLFPPLSTSEKNAHSNLPRPAIIILPGGSYRYLSIEKEMIAPAAWLNELGIYAFGLHYRLGPEYQHPVQFVDVKRAIRYIRYHSKEFNIDSTKIGVIGFSAGGHLASYLSTHFDDDKEHESLSSFISIDDPLNPAATDYNHLDSIDKISCRPDFQILIYPVIDFCKYYRVCSALLGDANLVEIFKLRELSTHLNVSKYTPQAFVCHTEQDTLVPIENSEKYVYALHDNEVNNVFIRGNWGGHGFGVTDKWTDRCQDWLNSL